MIQHWIDKAEFLEFRHRGGYPLGSMSGSPPKYTTRSLGVRATRLMHGSSSTEIERPPRCIVKVANVTIFNLNRPCHTGCSLACMVQGYPK
jgi:hypothetical protein